MEGQKESGIYRVILTVYLNGSDCMMALSQTCEVFCPFVSLRVMILRLGHWVWQRGEVSQAEEGEKSNDMVWQLAYKALA